MINVILDLSVLEDAKDPSTWLTLGRLRAALEPFGLASANRVGAFVAVLVEQGFLDRVRSSVDKRRYHLIPTQKFWQYDHDYVCCHLTEDELSGHREGNALPFTPGGALHREYRRQHWVSLDGFTASRQRHSEHMPFGDLDSSLLIFTFVFVEGMADSLYADDRGFEIIAKRAHVSRTHARTVLEMAERLGLMKIEDHGGKKIRLLPAVYALINELGGQSRDIVANNFQSARRVIFKQMDGCPNLR